MISELQIGTRRLLAPIHDALRDKLAAAVINPFILNGLEVWVERLEVLEASEIRFFSNRQANVIVRSAFLGERYTLADTVGQTILITQDVQVHLATRAGAVLTSVATRTFQVRFQVTSTLVEGKGVALSVAPASDPVVLIGSGDPGLLSFLGSQVDGLATPVSRTIPFDTFFLPYTSAKDEVTVGRSATVRMTLINSGIALSADGTFLSLRLEVPGFPNSVAPWTSFFQGMSTSRLAAAGSHGFVPSSSASPWSLFVQGDAFRYSVEEAIESALHDAAVFDNPPTVAVDWSAPGGGSRITVVVTGQKTLTTVLGEDIVGSTTITLTLDLSVPGTDQIQLDAGFRFTLDIAGVNVTSLVKLLAELLLSKLVGSTFSASNLLGGDSPLGPLSTNIQCVATSLSTLTCQGAVATPSVVGNLRDALGLDEGIVLMGSGEATASLLDPRAQLETAAFSWDAGGFGCPSPELVERARKQPLFDLLLASGSVAVTNALRGSRRLFINACRILDSVPGVYVESVTGAPNQYIIYVHCRYPPPAVPFVVAIYTNVGVKLEKLDPPPTLQNADVSEIVARAIRDSIPVCEKLINPWGGSFLNPEWLVDPSPELGSESYEQIWELEVPASSLGGTLTVNAGNNQSEVRITAAAGREFSASFVTNRGDRLKLHFREATRGLSAWHAGATANTSAAQLRLTETLLCKASSLSLGRTLEGIALVAGSSYPLLGAGLRSGPDLYDLSAPSDPRKVFQLAFDGLHGMAEGRLGQILSWGDCGLVAIERRDAEFVVRLVMDTPVQTVVRVGSRWFASTIEGIVVLDCDLQRERCIPRPGGYCGSLCSVERQLLWIARGEAFRLSSCGNSWIPVASDSDYLPHFFETLRVGRRDRLFAPRDHRGGSLWTVKSGRLSIECEFDDEPWFRRSARLTDVWAIADRAGVIAVYSVAGSRSTGGGATD